MLQRRAFRKWLYLEGREHFFFWRCENAWSNKRRFDQFMLDRGDKLFLEFISKNEETRKVRMQ